jgi:AcrR family transcriptional regulator
MSAPSAPSEPSERAAPGSAPHAARGRRTPRVSGDDRERAILATAEDLLQTRALHEISVDDLAKGAGISRPTFYFYFGSKEAVLLTLLDRMVERANALREASLAAAPPDPAARWRAAITAFHDAFAADRAVALAAAGARASSPEVRDLWARVMEGWVQETTAAIEAERARGAAPDTVPARHLAITLNWMNERVLHTTFAGEAPAVPADEVVDALVATWLGAIYAGAVPAA